MVAKHLLAAVIGVISRERWLHHLALSVNGRNSFYHAGKQTQVTLEARCSTLMWYGHAGSITYNLCILAHYLHISKACGAVWPAHAGLSTIHTYAWQCPWTGLVCICLPYKLACLHASRYLHRSVCSTGVSRMSSRSTCCGKYACTYAASSLSSYSSSVCSGLKCSQLSRLRYWKGVTRSLRPGAEAGARRVRSRHGVASRIREHALVVVYVQHSARRDVNFLHPCI